ncbi:MAG: tRNA 4-thiouridine(8) synthase ThiI [Elusimicrobiota bacterium]
MGFLDGILEKLNGNKEKKKAVALLSGGLDSLLAAKIMMEQGFQVIGVVFVMQFAAKDVEKFAGKVHAFSRAAGIDVRTVDISERFLKVLKSPEHGYGAQMNPCIDCKILMLRVAKEIMEREKAICVVTGEVLGERPMSQRKEALNIIRKKSALDGYLLRPLSAKLLDETIPEQEGVVDRNKLYAISGRSRAPQFELAKKFGLNKYFAPAGGCLLTDPLFAQKMQDLAKHGKLAEEEIALLKYGRHFRLDSETKAILGRSEEENSKLVAMKNPDDIVVRLKDEAGPYLILRGNTGPENLAKAAGLVISYSKFKTKDAMDVEYWKNEVETKLMSANPAGIELLEKRVG